MKATERISQNLSTVLNQPGDWDPPTGIQPKKPVIPLHIGIPDPDYLPLARLTSASQQLFANNESGTWTYGFGPGFKALREAIAAHWADQFGTVRDADHYQLTQGSSGAIDMVGRALINPGDVILMEYPCYMGSYRNFRALGAEIVFVQTDGEGIDIDHLRTQLEALNQQGRAPKFLYLITEFNNPTGACLAPHRRIELLKISQAFDLLILDDAAYAELRFDGRASEERAPSPLLATLANNRNIITVGSLSKTLATGLRIGWIYASPEWQEIIGQMRFAMGLNQQVVRVAHSLIEDGTYATHVQTMRLRYGQRMARLAAALADQCGDRISARLPAGGFYLWVKLACDHAEVWRAAYEEGLHVIPGRNFCPPHPEGSSPGDYLRLAYPYTPIDQFEEAASRLAAAISRVM
ncbi:MAG: PLP-dependent aminotransferase family protein [Pseudomonadales bacterium]